MGQREQGFKICFQKSQLRVYKATKKNDRQSKPQNNIRNIG